MSFNTVIIMKRVGNFVFIAISAMKSDLVDVSQCYNLVVNLGGHTEKSIGSKIINHDHPGQVDISRDMCTNNRSMDIILGDSNNIHGGFVGTDSSAADLVDGNIGFLGKIVGQTINFATLVNDTNNIE